MVEIVDAVGAPGQRIGANAWPERRVPRWWLASALAAVVAAAALGFVSGRAGRPASDVTNQAVSLRVVSIAPNGVIGGTGRRCAVRRGRELQLGVEVENLGPAAVQLVQLDILAPSREMRQISVGVGTCAQLGSGEPLAGSSLSTHATAWLSTIMLATVACPAGSAVEFRLTYMQAGQQASTKTFAFADLGQVPFAGCPSAT